MKQLAFVLITVVTVGGLIAGTTAPAHADTWKCLYKGKWVTTKTKNSDAMDWLLKWDSIPGGKWRVIGDYKDKYGHAWFDGECDARTCNFTQDYKEGKLVGKKYYFTGTYTDKPIDASTTENTFQGTWGYKPDDRTNGGTWASVATCHQDTASTATPPHPPPRAKPPSGKSTIRVTHNDAVDAMMVDATWSGYSIEMGQDNLLAIGGCRPGGTEQACAVDVYARSGKLVKHLAATVPDDETATRYDDLNQLKGAFDKLLAGNVAANKLVAHKLGGKPVVWETITIKWDAPTRTVTVMDGKKLFKKVVAPALGKDMVIDGASIYFFEAGSPRAGILQLEATEKEGIDTVHPTLVIPLPEIDNS
ncbi:MAG: hypothetical protein NT062_01465 [Proteobacteria bacterium]|nr:hypothetical protein [Pseudomonadota bacterium]